jgi:hypothetical protein
MPTKKAKNPPARKPSRLRQAAKQVAVDADQVRQDLGKLLLSLEDLSVEALKEVSDRALELIAEKSGVDKRSMIGAVIGGAVSIETLSRGSLRSLNLYLKRRRELASLSRATPPRRAGSAAPAEQATRPRGERSRKRSAGRAPSPPSAPQGTCWPAAHTRTARPH